MRTTARKDVQLELYEREQRGLRIAATCKLTKKGGIWLVPSQSGMGDTPSVLMLKRHIAHALIMKLVD